MNNDLEKKIWMAAKACPPSDHVPYAFEKRVMAALRGRAAQDPISLWAGLLWRSVAPCLALTIFLSFYAAQTNELPQSAPVVAEAEQTTPNLEETLLDPVRDEVSLALAW